MFETAFGSRRWLVGNGIPYGLTAEYEYRKADVGVVRRKRWDAVPKDGILIDSPDLLVFLKSRSNGLMEENAIAHVTHGASCVLLVEPERREIVMITRLSPIVCGLGDQLRLPKPLSRVISLDEIFKSEQ